MAEGTNVGGIYYTVSADTGKLVNSTDTADAALDKLQLGFGRTDAAAGRTEMRMTKTAAAVRDLGTQGSGAASAMQGLSRILAGLVTIQGVNGLIQMAEAYNEMAERVRMATSSVDEFDMVQRRLLDTANRTYRSLAEAQEVYIRTADALRAMGYSTEQAVDITDSLSYLFVTNAASADRAANATNAYAKVINKGKVEADAWESILAAIPTVVNDIAAASGRSAQEVRNLGSSGALTARELNEGLRQALDKNRAAADGMATTLRDAFTAFRNNLSAFVGEANQASGATQALSQIVIKLGENIDTISKLLLAAGAGALARYVAQIGAAAVAHATEMLAARASAAQTLKNAEAHAAATAAALAHARANAGLTGSYAALTAAEGANAAATTALAAAQRGLITVGGSLLSVLGGPVGIVSLVASAAAGFLLFRDNAQSAIPTIDQLAQSVENLSAAQLELRRQQVGEAIDKLTRQAKEAASETAALERDYNSLKQAFEQGRGVTAEGLDNVNKSLVEQRARQDEVNQELQRAIELQNTLRNVTPKGAPGAGPSAPQGDPEVAKRLQAMRDELELSKLTGEARAKLQAIQKLGANATAEERAEAERLAAQIYTLEQAQKNLTKGGKDAASSAQENAKALKSLAEELAQAALSGRELAVVRGQARLNEFATSDEVKRAGELAAQVYEIGKAADDTKTIEELSRQLGEASIRGRELAEVKALNQLSEFATPEQVETVTALARALYDAQQAEAARAQFGKTQKDATKFVTGDVDPLKGGAFDNQAARYDAERQAEEERYAEQLARLQQARELKIQLNQSYDDLEAQMAQTHADRLAQIDQARNSVMLQSASSAFGGIAAILKKSQGEQSGMYKAMFAVSKGFAIADATINAYNAISKAWASAPFPANLAAVAATTPQVLSVVSAISGTSFSGRQYGGPVGVGGMYRINENGAPEVLNMANGRQYLLPNQRGEVVSNREATGGSASRGNVIVNLIEDASRGGQVEQEGGDSDLIVRVFVADIRGGGRAATALESTYGLRRKGR